MQNVSHKLKLVSFSLLALFGTGILIIVLETQRTGIPLV